MFCQTPQTDQHVMDRGVAMIPLLERGRNEDWRRTPNFFPPH